MVKRPEGFNQFEFVVLAGLRAAQLTRGCTPRVVGVHKSIVIAQMEVAAYKVSRVPLAAAVPAVLPIE